MAKTYRYTNDTEQQNKQQTKRTKLSKQQAGRIEKMALRKGE